MQNNNLQALLKAKVIERSSANRNFRHHEWFVEYHLEVVEKIAHELCGIYERADPAKANIMVWLHDYEKIVDFDNQYNTELAATKALMQEVGFEPGYIEEIAEQLNYYNAKDNLQAAPIETQIVSSADAASHLTGPFITLYWYENPDKTIPELQAENLRKLTVDWEKKITLPEVKKAFEFRYQAALEIAGKLPQVYIP